MGAYQTSPKFEVLLETLISLAHVQKSIAPLFFMTSNLSLQIQKNQGLLFYYTTIEEKGVLTFILLLKLRQCCQRFYYVMKQRIYHAYMFLHRAYSPVLYFFFCRCLPLVKSSAACKISSLLQLLLTLSSVMLL